MVSRLHAKTNQIGKILNNLEKCNHMKKDGDNIRSPTTPSSVSKSILNKTSPTSPRCYSSVDNNVPAADYHHSPNNHQQSSANNRQKPSNNQQTNNQQHSDNVQQQQSLIKQPDSPNNNGETRVGEQVNGANGKGTAKPDNVEQSKANGEVSMEAEEQSTA